MTKRTETIISLTFVITGVMKAQITGLLTTSPDRIERLADESNNDWQQGRYISDSFAIDRNTEERQALKTAVRLRAVMCVQH
jgi:hypothetical protein